jgi:predicted RNase H-like HicB family nuclease
MRKPRKHRSKRQEVSRAHEYRFEVVFDPVPGGGYQVTAPLLPGLITYGRNLSEARAMARDALRCHLEGMKKAGEPIPDPRKARTEELQVAVVS